MSVKIVYVSSYHIKALRSSTWTLSLHGAIAFIIRIPRPPHPIEGLCLPLSEITFEDPFRN